MNFSIITGRSKMVSLVSDPKGPRCCTYVEGLPLVTICVGDSALDLDIIYFLANQRSKLYFFDFAICDRTGVRCYMQN